MSNSNQQSTSPMPVNEQQSGSLTVLSGLSSAFSPQIPEDLSPVTTPVDIVSVADHMAQMIRSYSVLPKESIDAIVLWLIASYAINCFRIFPKLSLISPVKRCGKTTTLEAIQSFALNGVLSSNMSPATIYRLTSSDMFSLPPTVMIDEADTYVKNGDPGLIGLINSGHNQKAAHVLRCEGDGHTPTVHNTWMPMVLASIGDLPPTIMDRSIVINLRRKKSTESVSSMPVDLWHSNKSTRASILGWCAQHASQLRSVSAVPPALGNDRAADNWQPLFNVAHLMNESWVTRCEDAYRYLTVVEEADLPTQLLTDIRDIFCGMKDTRIPSDTLVSMLNADELMPWAEQNSGRGINSYGVVKLLGPYDIKPRPIRFGDKVLRGYELADFDDAFERYLA